MYFNLNDKTSTIWVYENQTIESGRNWSTKPTFLSCQTFQRICIQPLLLFSKSLLWFLRSLIRWRWLSLVCSTVIQREIMCGGLLGRRIVSCMKSTGEDPPCMCSLCKDAWYLWWFDCNSLSRTLSSLWWWRRWVDFFWLKFNKADGSCLSAHTGLFAVMNSKTSLSCLPFFSTIVIVLMLRVWVADLDWAR